MRTMRTFQVRLPDELAAFIDQCLADGEWENTDQVFEQAVAMFRISLILGTQPDIPTADAPEREPLAVAASAAPAASELRAPLQSPQIEEPRRPAVDLTRNPFDSPAFMADLMDKIRGKR